MKNIYHHPNFVQYKKSQINLFPLYNIKKNSIREKKFFLRKNNKIGNILKGKKSKGKEINCRCIRRCYAIIHGATIKKYFI